MATTFTDIRVIQDNILNDIPLLTVNNPLAFIVEVDFTGDKPANIPAELWLSGSVVDNYKAIPYKDTSDNTRQFIFFASEYIKAFMPPVFDELITSGTFTEIEPLDVKIRFSIDSSEYVDIEFKAIDGVRQFSDEPGASAFDIYNNEYNYFYSTYGGFCYLYFYAKDTGGAEVTVGAETFALDQITFGKFYRLKLLTDWVGEKDFSVTRTFTMDPEAPATNTFLTGKVNAINQCNARVLKYYDRNGQYRFLPAFLGQKTNSYDTQGFVSKYVTSIRSGDSDRYIKGKTNEEIIELSIINFPKKDVWLIEDLLSSPYVYMHINENLQLDELTDWLMVEVQNNSFNIRYRGDFLNVTLRVRMPKKYTITT